MAEISVLLSTYNESIEDIKNAINSILEQTFTDFELIIVNDNPDNKLIIDYLDTIKNKKNVKVIYNKENIGLANCMNKAYKIASGKYIARMDADDISVSNRFERQIELMKTGIYDLVCTNFHFIDTKNQILDKKHRDYSGLTLEKAIFRGNVIHHPTVMMTREIFEKVGGYRDFPCSQDYDLWLRMAEIGAKFYLLNEDLLGYRIREESVSNKRSMYQIATLYYIKFLSNERRKKSKDSYSLENYQDFLKKIDVSAQYEEKYLEAKDLISYFKDMLKKKRFIKAILLLREAVAMHKLIIHEFWFISKFVVYLKINGENKYV